MTPTGTIEQYTGNDDEWDDLKHLTHRAWNKEHREKRGHAGQHREDDRRRDLTGPFDSAFQPVSVLFLVGMNILTHHDGIVGLAHGPSSFFATAGLVRLRGGSKKGRGTTVARIVRRSNSTVCSIRSSVPISW